MVVGKFQFSFFKQDSQNVNSLCPCGRSSSTLDFSSWLSSPVVAASIPPISPSLQHYLDSTQSSYRLDVAQEMQRSSATTPASQKMAHMMCDSSHKPVFLAINRKFSAIERVHDDINCLCHVLVRYVSGINHLHGRDITNT